MPLLHPGSWDSVYLTREVVTLEIFRQLIIICDGGGLSERRQNNWGSDLFHIEDLESDICADVLYKLMEKGKHVSKV